MKKLFTLMVICTLAASPAFSAGKKKKSCNALFDEAKPTGSNTLYAKKFNISEQDVHTPRLVADMFNLPRVKRDIMALSGRLNIDCDGCIPGRYDEQQKERVRNYLVARLAEFGLKAEVDAYVYHVEKKRNRKSKFDDAFIPSEASDSELKEIWRAYNFRDLKKYLVRHKNVEDDPKYLKTLGLEELEEIRKEVKSKAAGLNDKSSLNKKEADELQFLNWVKMDVDTHMQALLDGIELLKERESGKSQDKKDENNIIEHWLHNVIVEIPGTEYPNEVIELNAHYDTTADNKPGADDNGSGVATLLEIGRLLSEFKPKRTVRLVFADLEEEGFHGTIRHVGTLADKDEVFLGGLVVDTIGYAPVGPKYPAVPEFVVEAGEVQDHSPKSFKELKTLTEALAFQNARYNDRLVKMSIETDGAMPGTADHGPYWADAFPAVLIAAPYEGDYINPGYHKESDVIEQYNWGFFEGVAGFIIEGVALAAEVTLTEAQKKALTKDVERMDYYRTVYTNPNPRSSRFPKPKPKPKDNGKKSGNSWFSFGGGNSSGSSSDNSASGSIYTNGGSWLDEFEEDDI